MNRKIVYTGSCFCGAVGIRAEGAPFLMGYCHCNSCRHWSAAPANAFALWSAGDVGVTKGAAQICTYNKTEAAYRKSCATCGGHLYLEHPSMGLADIRPAIIRGLRFTPAIHIFYAESVLPIDDGRPKFDAMPDEEGAAQ